MSSSRTVHDIYLKETRGCRQREVCKCEWGRNFTKGEGGIKLEKKAEITLEETV